MSDIKRGDYVRITIEGPWVGDDTTEGEQFDGDVQEYVSEPGDRVFLEKIEPPVEVFKPGDRLRRKVEPDGYDYGYEITVADEGYLQHFDSNKSTRYFAHSLQFTSETYERVYPG